MIHALNDRVASVLVPYDHADVILRHIHQKMCES